MPTARVLNFLPSMSAFHFPNSWCGSNVADLVSSTLPLVGAVGLGNPGNGLCGGFVFAAIDFFNGQPRVLMRSDLTVPIAPTTNPSTPGDPIFNYLFERLLDTFVEGLVGPKTLLWLTLPTHDTWLSGWLSPHGIAWLMVNEEWPAIKSDLDNGMLSPIGIVTDNIHTCHQVLAHGYDLDGDGNLTIYCYDPNEPSQDGVATFNLNISQSYNTIPIQANNISANDENATIRGIFHSIYSTAHVAAEVVGSLAIGEVPPSAQALQPLAPAWNAWESPFSQILNRNGITIQNPTDYTGSPVGGPYLPLNPTSATTPSICTWGRGRLDLFVQDQSGFADHLWWDNAEVGCDQLNLSVVSCPCATSWGNERVDAFAVLNELDYSLAHFWLDGGQLQQSESLGRPLGNWNGSPIPLDGSAESAIRLGETVGRYFVSPPSTCSWGEGQLDVFVWANIWDPQTSAPASTNDAKIVHLPFNGDWLQWRLVPLPGGITPAEGSSVTSVSSGAGRIDTFIVTNASQMLHAVYTSDQLRDNDAWSDWENLGAPATVGAAGTQPVAFSSSQPSVVSWGPGRLDVFVIGADGHLYHQFYSASSSGSGNWASSWEDLGNPLPVVTGLQGSPTACSWAVGRLDVFARGTDVDKNENAVPALWHRSFDGVWSDWGSLGGVLQSDPVAVSWGPNRIDTFAPGGNIFSLGSQDWVPWHIWFQN